MDTKEIQDEYAAEEILPPAFVAIMKHCPECGGRLDDGSKHCGYPSKGCPECCIVFAGAGDEV